MRLNLGIQHDFTLSDSFLAPYAHRPVPWGPVGLPTYLRSYSRIIDGQHARPGEVGTRESWWQTVRRVVEGCYNVQRWHCQRNHLPWSDRKAQASAQAMYDLIFTFKFTPPGRGLWMMGTDFIYERGVGGLLNCAFVSTQDIQHDFAGPFVTMMDMLMLDCGVGSDVRGAGKMMIRQPVVADDIHVITDDREGWIAVVRRHLDAYVGKGTLPGVVDASYVRPQGARIHGKGGTATGPEPLLALLRHIRATLEPLVGKPITATAIADLLNRIGACTVHGSDRRSAEILLGAPDDAEFAALKDPTLLNQYGKRLTEVEALLAAGANGMTATLEAERVMLAQRIAEHPLRTHRWASNNSVLAEVGMDYAPFAARAAANGEPGFFWFDTVRTRGRLADPANDDDADVLGVNPCGEQALSDREACNLVEVFPANHAAYADFQRTLKFAYLYAKTVTLLPHHDPRTNAVMMRKRRIGLSLSGIVQAIARHGRRAFFSTWCDRGYRYLRSNLDVVYSNWLAIPRSVRITTVKPAGTTSLLPGASPGVHQPWAEHYVRRIRFAASTPLPEALRRAGYPVEPDVYSDSTLVVEFPVKEPHFVTGTADVTMWEQLEMAAAMQHWWSDNAVSCTVSFAPHEAAAIPRALELYETRLKGISFLPTAHGYAQAPYETITAEEYERRAAMLRPDGLRLIAEQHGKPLDLHDSTPKFCDGETCEVPVREQS